MISIETLHVADKGDSENVRTLIAGIINKVENKNPDSKMVSYLFGKFGVGSGDAEKVFCMLTGTEFNQNVLFIMVIHPIQWTIALPVGATSAAKRQKKSSCVSTGRTSHGVCIC